MIHTTDITSPVVHCGRLGGRVAEDVSRTKEEGEEHGDAEQSKTQVYHERDLAMSSEHHRTQQSRKTVEVTEQEANAAQHRINHTEGDHLSLREGRSQTSHQTHTILFAPSQSFRAKAARVNGHLPVHHQGEGRRTEMGSQPCTIPFSSDLEAIRGVLNVTGGMYERGRELAFLPYEVAVQIRTYSSGNSSVNRFSLVVFF